MRFPRFLHRREREAATSGPGPELQNWAHLGIAEEVEEYLAGRYVDFLAGRGRPVPAWAVVNRLAHATRDEMARVVEGDLGPDPRTKRHVAWEESERFIAARLLACTSGSDDLAALQRDTLIPLELALILRYRTDRLDAEQVLAASAEAVDSSLLG
jgi:hypothetical protein